MSTFLVECDTATWQRYGFADKTIEESQAICEQVFAATLDGHPLLSNKSVWRNFPWIWNEQWSVGQYRADRRRAAFGAFLDRLGHAPCHRRCDRAGKALEAEPDISTALVRYQTERKPIVQKLVKAARTSADWYEKFPEHMSLGPMDFAYSYITRSGRIDDARLRAMSPEFMARYEAFVARMERSAIRGL